MMDIWVYFRDASAAKGHLSLLDFSKFSDKDSAWDGNTCRSKHLMELIKRICNNEKPLFVQCSRLKEVILQKLEIQCLCVDDDDVILELIWGINNVLECFIKSFIKEEIDNIERGCLPFSKGLEKCLEDYCISVPKEMLNKKLISQLGFVRYLEISSKEIANKLRESFDKHVCNIGESIEDDLNYTKVLARILVPEIATEFNFSQMFSGELALKVQEAEKSECVTEYRKKQVYLQ
uniref:Uncharacterized protein n=1 Tax=Arundo donax TaxID=35708 RepID=A0A0A9CR92_ARUDO